MATGIRSTGTRNCDGSSIVVLDHFLDNFTTRRIERARNEIQKTNKRVENVMPEYFTMDISLDGSGWKFYQHK